MSLYKTKFKNVLSEKVAMQTYKWDFFTIENQEVGNLGMSAKIIGLCTYMSIVHWIICIQFPMPWSASNPLLSNVFTMEIDNFRSVKIYCSYNREGTRHNLQLGIHFC